MRTQVSLVLLLAATTTGGLVGFAGGVVLAVAGIGSLPVTTAAGVVVVAAAADLLIAPPSIRRQVPQAWGRLLGPTTAALLYGARLGPGPLTILNSWLWWAGVAVAWTTGPWGGAAVGGCFGALRVLAMLGAGPRAGRLRRHDGAARLLSSASTAVVTVAVAATLGAGAVAPPSVEAQPQRPASTVQPVPTTTRELPRAQVPAASDLAGRLPNDAGPGFRRLADDPAKGLGPLDLQVAAALERDEMAERSLLETRGFEGGHARGWRHADGRTAYAAVYRFPSNEDAEAYRRDGTITLEGRGISHAGLEHPAGAVAFRQVLESAEGSRVADTVVLVRGRHFALVIVTQPSSPAEARDAEVLAGLVADQLVRDGS